MIIGRFAENPASGLLIGHIRTLFFKSDKVVFEPIADGAANAPSHRVYTADEVELGAAWRKEGKADGTVYYDVTLDDPTFAAPIHARLVRAKKKGTGLIMLWERQSRRQSSEPKAA
jgi:uncharacterized protein (DUF736 family)